MDRRRRAISKQQRARDGEGPPSGAHAPLRLGVSAPDTAVAAHGRVVRRPASTPLRSEGGRIQTAGGAACPQPSYSEPATYRVPSWMQPFSLSLRAMPSALESCPVDRQITPGPDPASGHSAS
jgi:hypothetical protein